MKHPDGDPASGGGMTKEQAEHMLADALEDYHRHKARGERPDEVAFQNRLGDLYPEFLELIAAETLIDRAIEPAGEESHLPMAWGAYTLLREIARGAAGVVYEAVHRKLGRKVALKVLRTGVDTDETARERFQREAQALAQIKHDHIVEIYEFGEVDKRPYYAMSLIRGPTLADVVKSGNLPDAADACRGLAGIADAMMTLHAAGIIHRDIKPSNIMIDRDGRYMLADFGLARSAMSATMTRSGDALGTPLYMSPEQILGNRKAIEARTDIYGLGATLYQVLTGQPPFKTESLQALMRMILRERPTNPRQFVPDLPVGASRIAMKCLEKEPRDRYESAQALRTDLLACAEGTRVSGKPLTPMQRGLRLVRNHPIASVAAAVLIGFLIALAVQPPAPARFELSTSVPADASINGAEWASTPLDLTLPSEKHYHVVVHPKDPAYLNRELSFEAIPHASILKELLLEPRDGARNEDALDLLRSKADIKAPPVADPGTSTHRGLREPEALFPRGKVRMQDLSTWHVVGEYGEGSVDFEIEGEVIASISLEEAASGPLPQALVKRLKPGVEVHWGVRRSPREAIKFDARFTIVEVDLDEQIAKIDTLLEAWKNEAHRADAARILRAELLLKHELAFAAWRLIQAPYEAKRGPLRSQAALAMNPAAEREDAALDALEELRDVKVGTEPGAAEAHAEALRVAKERVARIRAEIDQILKPAEEYEARPEELRSLRVLALQQAAIEQLFPGTTARKESSLWAQHTEWRKMFSPKEWAAFYAR